MPFLKLPDYTLNRARCIPAFLGLLRSFSHKTETGCTNSSLAQFNSTSSFNPGPLRGPSYSANSFVRCAGTHQPPTCPQGRPKAPPRHAAALLNPPPRFTQSPRLANTFSSTCLLLPCPARKKDTKTATKQPRIPPPLTLSLALWAAVGS